MIVTEVDLGFTLGSDPLIDKYYIIIDEDICYYEVEENNISILKKSNEIDQEYRKNILDDYNEYIKPYFKEIKCSENDPSHHSYYSDFIKIFYDIPEEILLWWKLKY